MSTKGHWPSLQTLKLLADEKRLILLQTLSEGDKALTPAQLRNKLEMQSSTLASFLGELAAEGLVVKASTPPNGSEYRTTEKGRNALEVVLAAEHQLTQHQSELYLIRMFAPVRRFVDELVKKRHDLKDYVTKGRTCIVGIEPDGVFYAWALYNEFQNMGYGYNLTYATMGRQGESFEEDKFRDSNVLLVDNDIISGTTMTQVKAYLTKRARRLGIGEVKVAVYTDRKKMADYYYERLKDDRS